MMGLVGANDVERARSERSGLCGLVDVERNVGEVGECGGGRKRR